MVVAVHHHSRRKREKERKESTRSYTVHFTSKENVHGTIDHLLDKFNEDLLKLKKHVFNIQHQYHMYREEKQNLSEKEALIHIDFAESCSCKYPVEIQSMHFGSGHQSTTLHTGVYHVQVEEPSCFCAVSPSLRPQPACQLDIP